ncbi:MAG TPA: tetratricopeptide repeat protein [Sedimentisphaerales bacterium]|nr:tetratricopeptide repeat protein [Sedimentisphaerales bacterium]HRV47953.1 tetratricopeptide repeat protein [Sedimentisphaerales bacterium]
MDRQGSRRRRLLGIGACILWALGSTGSVRAAGLDASQEQFRKGQYRSSLDSAQKAIADSAYQPQWRILLIESMLALGQYDQAAREMDSILIQYPLNLTLLKLAHRVYTSNGQLDLAREMLEKAYRIASARRLAFITSSDLVALGQSLLLLGAEPRIVLRDFYNRALENDPNCREAYLAAGDLAMAKQDYELAAEQFHKALGRFGDDPDAHCGLAKAFYHNNRQAMMQSLDAALAVNPHHAPALILLAEHQIDCEDYDGAAKSLGRVLEVNPWRPEAWAYRALLAHLGNDPNEAKVCRAKALKFWATNPQVDHLIGAKLSQKYRFSEGSTYQRRALQFDPNYVPARIQLAEDLLRLGQEEPGWTLAKQVADADPYNVKAYNLATLHNAISKFKTLEADGFVLRMNELEAAVYGDEALALLKQARSALCEKYGLQLDSPVTVELFANPQDFAVRTFGIPDVDGYLGVCFGSVITANSPKAQRPANWQAVLWHEFCHVVTLHLTRNKMPRWLSEGISVYEESQRNPTWGQRMTPQYRRMILTGERTPIGKLSGAFLSPPTPTHLQFAYFESSLAVEFLIERFGLESMKAILADLGDGAEINATLSKHAAPLAQLEAQFDGFARTRAEALAPEIDWDEPGKEQVDPADPQAVAEWLAGHPNSFWALRLQAQTLLESEQWEEAKKPLERLISLYPAYVEDDNAYQLLAAVHRKLGETKQERDVLSRLAALSADAADAYLRLMEIATEQEDWEQVAENGDRYLAVYPMLNNAYWWIGRAAEELGRSERAVESYRRLLLLDPADPVEVHYRLAQLLRHEEPAAARRHILEALADAPRFRDGHRLLLEIVTDSEGENQGGAQ